MYQDSKLGMQLSMDFTKAVSNYGFNHEAVSTYGVLSRLSVEKWKLIIQRYVVKIFQYEE